MSRVWRGKSGSSVRIDLALTVLIALFAGFYGASVGRSQQGEYYQKYFAPAVMLAWGFGYRQPIDCNSPPGLCDFLSRKTEAVEPPALGTPVPTETPNQFQQVHRYLIGSVGVCWWLLGVSWKAVWPIYAILFAMTLVAVYWLGRAWVSPIFSVVLVVTFGCSGLVGSEFPNLRDFSKAPFILAAIAICCHVVSQPITRSGLVCLSAFAGLVIGVGLGFRMDLITVVPCVILAVGLFSSVQYRHAMMWRGLALMCFFATMAASSWPILQSFGQGSNSWHVIVLGLMSHFDSSLKILPAETHELGFKYLDAYVISILTDFAHRVPNLPNPVKFGTSGYDRVGMAYWLTVLTCFPADIAARAMSATRLICSTGFTSGAAVVVQILVLLTLFGFSARQNRSLGLFAIVLVCYAGLIASLQFHPRHHFYLYLIPVMAFCLLGQEAFGRILAVRGLAFAFQTRLGALHEAFAAPRPGRCFAARGLLTLSGAGVLIFVVGLWALRQYQAGVVREMQQQFEGLSSSACSYSVKPIPSSTGLIGLIPDAPVTSQPAHPIRYWLLELGYAADADCDLDAVSIVQDCGDSAVYSRSMSFDVSRAAVGEIAVRYVFFTCLEGCSRLRLVMHGDCLPVVRRFCSLDGASQLPLPINMFLSVAGREMVPYQRLLFGDAIDHPKVSQREIFPTAITALSPSDRLNAMGHAELNPAEIQIFDFATVVRDGRIEYGAVPPTPYHYIAALPQKSSSNGDVVVVRGHLERGGIGVGVLRDGKWADQMYQGTPGPFEFILRPGQGVFRPMLYHVTPDGPSVFMIDRFDWVHMTSDQPPSGRTD